MGRPHKKGLKHLPKKYRCSFCGRMYRMEWTLKNHEKVCPWKFI